MRTAWWVAGLLFLMGCGGVGPAPCDGNPSACDGGAPDAGAGADPKTLEAGRRSLCLRQQLGIGPPASHEVEGRALGVASCRPDQQLSNGKRFGSPAVGDRMS